MWTVAFLIALALPQPVAAGEHPIAGVISLLQKLMIQSKEESATEAASFQKFTYWCKTSTKTLTKAIHVSKETIASETDKIDGLTADIATLGEDIATLADDIKKMETAAQKAKNVRKDEKELYDDEQKNFADTITAIDEAITVLKGSKPSLVQTGAQKVVQKAQDLAEAMGKPAAKTYSFKSGGIIETFKAMKAEFEADKLDSTSAETNKLNAYNLAKQARDEAIKTAKASKKDKEDIKGGKESGKAASETTKSETETALSDDTASLEQTDKECKTTTGQWEERSATREGEIKAMEMAIKILSKVTGVRNPDEHDIAKKALLEATARVDQDTASYEAKMAGISFLQLEDPKTKAVNLLKKAATQAHSKALQKLAQEISTFDGPFDKIKQMIQKMIFRLMSEQKDEDDHKNWCDMEMEKSTESKTDKDEKIKLLTKKVGQHDAAIKKLIKAITANNDKAATITKYMEEETELRNENHAECEATIKDSQDAQAAVTQAIQVLKDFYKESGMIAKEPWEFVQIKSQVEIKSHRGVDLPKSPDTWDSSYTGVTDPENGADGVLGLLDGVMTKFSNMEATTKVADTTDQENYEKDMQAKKISLEETKQDTQMKTTKKDSLQEKMEGLQGTLKHTTSEFDAVVQYLKDLQPACGEGDSSYEDRKKARADEITALRKAQTILEDAFRAKFLQK